MLLTLFLYIKSVMKWVWSLQQLLYTIVFILLKQKTLLRIGLYTATEFREYVDYLEKLYSNLYCWAKDDDKWKELPDDMLEERILNLKEFNRNPVNHENQEWANKNNSKNHEKYREQQKSRSYIYKF